ncbi:hypothetical protein [Nannocystis bainbridge]|uniref:Uncharacterized protein n=1 Tax=Nannocystis bainbridge TaxID=2995303 RepID=A0ABT5E9A1_9BACT|nr:hypothetical protein [Nannocystis bainbridge]MDC0722438.1 hypothetical protein [Nannocystis bainbridge]
MNSLARPCTSALALALVSACPGDPATTSDSATSSSSSDATTDATTDANTVTGPATTSGDATATEPTTTEPTSASTTSDTTTSGPEEAALWLVPLVSPGGAAAHSVAIAGDGAVIVGGVFAGTLELGDTSLVSAGGLDLFVARWTAGGQLVWARRFGGPDDEHEASVSVGSDGRVLLVGEFRSALELPGLDPLVSLGLSDILVLQLAADGAPEWSRGFGGLGVELEPRAVFDDAGDIVLSAAFESLIDLGGGPLAAADARDLLLAKFDATGAHLWSKSFGNLADASAHDLAVGPAGDIAVAGWFANSIDLGGGPFADGGAYLAVFAGDTGEHRWSQQLASGNSAGCGVRFAGDGGVALSGWFQGAIDFGSGPALATDEHADHFAARWSADGDLTWAGTHGGPNVDTGCGLAPGPDGGWILGGTFNQQIEFGGELLTKKTAPCAFLASLDDGGDHRWSLPLCAAAGGSVDRLATYPEGHVVLLGSFAGPVELFGQSVDAPHPYGLVAHVPAHLLGR